MKKLLTILVALIFSVVPMLAGDDAVPVVEFTETNHDFGILKEKQGRATYEFEFVNKGTAPLVIVSATSTCGCTRPEFPTEPIKPGKKGKIKVTYLTEGRPGEFNKTVKVRTNDRKHKNVALRITGVVVSD